METHSPLSKVTTSLYWLDLTQLIAINLTGVQSSVSKATWQLSFFEDISHLIQGFSSVRTNWRGLQTPPRITIAMNAENHYQQSDRRFMWAGQETHNEGCTWCIGWIEPILELLSVLQLSCLSVCVTGCSVNLWHHTLHSFMHTHSLLTKVTTSPFYILYNMVWQ